MHRNSFIKEGSVRASFRSSSSVTSPSGGVTGSSALVAGFAGELGVRVDERFYTLQGDEDRRLR